MSTIRRSFFFSSVTQYLNKLISFAFVVITARMLTPEELGLYAIASGVVIVASEFRLMGATNYLVRSEKIDKSMVCSGLGLTICICWPLALLIVFASDHVANFYDLAPLALLFKILAIPFLVAPFISISACMLTREMAFHKIMIIRLTSLIVKIVSSVYMMWLGYSYYALAWGLVIATAFEIVLYFFMRSDIVSWKPSFKGLRPIFHFGIYNTLINALHRFESVAPDIILGKFANVRDVALFSRGAGFLTFVNEMVTAGVWQVALPAMSKVKREGGDVSEGYIKASLMLGGLVLPVLGVAAYAAEPVILMIFGEQWEESVPVAQVIVGWVMFKSIHTLSTPLMITTANEKPLLVKQVCVFAICLGLGILAAPSGMMMMAWAMVCVGIADYIITSLFLWRYLQISIFSFALRLLSNLLISLCCVAATALIDNAVDFSSAEPLFSVFVIALILPFVWLACIYLFKHPLRNEISLVARQIRTRFAAT
ncbi:oligosaccharide flippase family protein [Alteromonas sp. H39]|uniref:oligosaccharide flippase family protein n=1 Tax=Alteromonas sp. H39 TaxID=3389876 RepID=UPI0039DFFD61